MTETTDERRLSLKVDEQARRVVNIQGLEIRPGVLAQDFFASDPDWQFYVETAAHSLARPAEEIQTTIMTVSPRWFDCAVPWTTPLEPVKPPWGSTRASRLSPSDLFAMTVCVAAQTFSGREALAATFSR